MQKNKTSLVHLLLLLITLLSGNLLPFTASAYELPGKPETNRQQYDVTKGITVNYICPNTSSTSLDDGLVVRIVPCIRDVVVYATVSIMKESAKNVAGAFMAIFAMALTVFGIAVATGHTPSFSQNGIILAIKIGAIVLFANNFGGYYPHLLNSVENMLNIMAKPAMEAFAQGGAWNRIGNSGIAVFNCKYGTFQTSETNIMDIWNLTDCYLDMIVGGIFSETTLKMGILGFLLGALLSNTIGLFVGLVGVYMLVNALFTIFRTVYIFLTSYVAFSFMVIISIIFIPTILFQSTKRFFDGWLRLTISFLLQPLFVFGYLIMFMVAINTAIFQGKHSLYYAIVGEDSQSRTPTTPGVVRGNFYIGEWMTDTGVYKETLKLRDLGRINADEGTGNQLDDTAQNTVLQGIQASRSKTAEKTENLLGNLADDISRLNFFEMGIPVGTIDWELMAQLRNPTRWAQIYAMPTTTPAEIQAHEKAADKFYLDYKISVLLALLMAAIVVYLFYSLIEYMPFIGTATLGDGGILPFGEGSLAPPGSGLLGRSR